MFYELGPPGGYEWINLVDPTEYEYLLTIDGPFQTKPRKVVRVVRVRPDEKSKGLESNFPWLGSDTLIMRKRAVQALQPILKGCEILPLTCADAVELYLVNPPHVDAMNEKKSDVLYFSGTSRVMMIRRVALNLAEVQGREIFKLRGRAGPVFVGQRFVDICREAGLKELKFSVVETWQQ